MGPKIDPEALKAEMEKRKAAEEEAKKEKERRKAERLKTIEERIGSPKSLDGVDEAGLKLIMQTHYDRLLALNNAILDYEKKCAGNAIELRELNTQVLDLRGKFIPPKLKKVTVEFDEL